MEFVAFVILGVAAWLWSVRLDRRELEQRRWIHAHPKGRDR